MNSQPILVGNNDNELGFNSRLGGGAETSPEAMKRANDIGFSCPAGFTAEARSRAGVPVWRYRYMSVWPNTALVPGMGAYHTSEIPLVFGTSELKPNATEDLPEEAALSKNMRHAWATFAKDPQNGLKKMGWPKYDPKSMFTRCKSLKPGLLI